ncbi:MAG: 50S ribosomal protein L13 [Nitrospinae bacterium]|nr:50S ribosomal protein L13 [Nitrospinota bacterium]
MRMYQKTVSLTKEQANAQRGWVLVDAKDQTLGRLCTRVATLLRGKHKPDWTPHVDNGEYVVVINAERIVLTGRKLSDKKYYRHSGYPGHLKEVSAGRMLETHPERVIEHAVRGMLPKNKLGRSLLQKLKVYAGDKHPHQAQQPEAIELD